MLEGGFERMPKELFRMTFGIFSVLFRGGQTPIFASHNLKEFLLSNLSRFYPRFLRHFGEVAKPSGLYSCKCDLNLNNLYFYYRAYIKKKQAYKILERQHKEKLTFLLGFATSSFSTISYFKTMSSSCPSNNIDNVFCPLPNDRQKHLRNNNNHNQLQQEAYRQECVQQRKRRHQNR